MKNLRLALLVGAVFFSVALALYWWLKPQPVQPPTAVNPTPSQPAPADPLSARPTQPTPIEPTKNEPDTNQQKALMTAFLTPISFWGKVVDEHGNAVPDATVELTANNNPNPMEQGSRYQRFTDNHGLFSISGIHGIALNVKVSKEGYYQTAESRGGANYLLKSNTDRPVPTAENPAVFVLRKKGEAAELTHVTERPVKVPKNRVPVEISFETGQAVPAGQGDLRIECWTEDQKKDAQGNYPWRCRVSIPSGGGLIKRQGEFDFEAPIDGYQASDDITPPGERWSATAERQYFVKTVDGHFARVTLRVRTGGEHFVVIQSYLNPKPGSRNLEYDPTKPAATR
jgi:hypothetical protein